MILVIIACTLLIIVCLGGGKRLGQIILGALAFIGLAVFALNNEGGEVAPHMGALTVVAIGAFFALMVISKRLSSKRPDEPR